MHVDVETALESRAAKGISLAVAAVCLWCVSGMGSEVVLRTAFALVFPLAMIWFGNYLQHYRGWANFRMITKATPGMLIQLLGWTLLGLDLFLALRSAAS